MSRNRNRNKRKPNNNYNSKKNVNVVQSFNEKSNDSSLQEDSNCEEIIKIKRTCKVGDININKVKYTIESYKDALERFHDKSKCVDIFFGNDNPYEYFDFKRFMHVENTCCTIVKIDDEYVEFKCKDNDILNMIKENIGNTRVHMRYTGNFIKEANDIKLYSVVNIFAFDIIIKGDYPYKTYSEYLIHKKEMENINE